MHAALGVDGQRVGVCKDHARRANGGKCTSVDHDASADCGCGIVTRAADHDRALGQTGLGCRLCGHTAGDFRALVNLGEQGFINLKLFQHLVRPAAVGYVQQTHTRRIGHLGGVLAGQHQTNIVLGQQDMTALCVNFRLVIPHPQNLAGGKAGQRRVGGQLDQAFLADPLVDFFALFGRASITPQDSRTQDLIVLIQHHKRVHLTGNADALDVRRLDGAVAQHLGNAVAYGVPPVVRVLLCPAVLRLLHGIFISCTCDHTARGVKQRGLGARSADVNAK